MANQYSCRNILGIGKKMNHITQEPEQMPWLAPSALPENILSFFFILCGERLK